MCDTNWCTFCDCAVNPYSDSIYCSEHCFRRDALTHHPLLRRLQQEQQQHQQQKNRVNGFSKIATLVPQQQQEQYDLNPASKILDTPSSLLLQNLESNSSKSSSVSSEELALIHLDHTPELADKARSNNKDSSKSIRSACTSTHALDHSYYYSSNSHLIYTSHPLSLSLSPYTIQ